MLSEGKISLRSLKIDDKKILALLANNKNIFDNVRDHLPFPYKESDAEEFIQFVQKENPQSTFAIEYEGQFCGVCGLMLQTDVYRKTSEIGYWLGEPFWNKGIATAAVKLLTQYGFKQLDLVRIHTGVFEYNLASMKVLEKCGYEKAGIFKKSVLKNGSIWDEHRYSKVR
jgi:[ribosomal protein S5]-alanine N-acetyltransferase